MADARVAVVLVAYRNWDDTSRCIESIERMRIRPSLIVVVNNSADVPMPESLRRQGISHVLPSHNLGFAGGCNVGARHALEHGSEFVWFLNTDTVVEESALESLLDVCAENPSRFGACSSVTVLMNHPTVVQWSGGQMLPLATGVRVRSGVLLESLPKVRWERVTFLHGCSLLIRSEAFAASGGFSEPYFMYFEDADLSARLSKLGFTLWNTPRSVVHHSGGGAGGGIWSANGAYFYARNRIWFARAHGIFIVSVIATLALHLAWSLRQRLVHRRHIPWLRVFAGLGDGLFTRPADEKP